MNDAEVTGAPDLFDPTTHRFLSAHYDDIALSCGGTVALLAHSGASPEIRVAFGSEPDQSQPLSGFAADQHRWWGLSAREVIRARRAEEAAAVALLGATSIPLSFRDAIYRGSWYQSDKQLFDLVAAAEAPLAGQIAAEFQAPDDARATTRYYAPLGVGNHVDHQLCFAAGLALAADGWDVWYYEDLPYGLRPGALELRLDQIAAAWLEIAPARLRDSHLGPVARIAIDAVWELKVQAILAYASQVPTIFRHVAPDGSPVAIEAALRDYALRAGDGVPAERFWRVSGVGQG